MLNWNAILATCKSGNPPAPRRVEKTDAEWRSALTPEQYHVARAHGTERPFSGEYCERVDAGRYACVCCQTELFDATEKFESGTGWPSFTTPVVENHVQYILDSSHGMQRVEVRCNVCDAHLGHVFPDGPEPTGLRYCINSVALVKTT